MNIQQGSTISAANHPRYLLLKIDPRPRRRADRLTDYLIKAGFQVTDTGSLQEAKRIISRVLPTIVVVFDDLRRGVDAVAWLHHQQAGVSAQLAMTPLLIVANPSRQRHLRVQELPDRVQVLPHDVSSEALAQFIYEILSAWLF